MDSHKFWTDLCTVSLLLIEIVGMLSEDQLDNYTLIEGRVEPRSADPDGGQHSPRRPGQHSPHPRRIREKVSIGEYLVS